MRLNDAVSGVVLVLFAVVMIAYTSTFPALPGQDYGPNLFPRLIGLGMLGTGLVLIAGGLRQRPTQPWFGGAGWVRSPPRLARFASVVGGLLLYVLIAQPLGFIPTALALLFTWLVLFRGGRPASSFGIALIVVLVVNYAFTQLLLVPLPLGVLQTVLY